MDAIVGYKTQLIHLLPKHLEHGQRSDTLRIRQLVLHRLWRHVLDPRYLQAKRFGSAYIERIARHEEDIGRRDAKSVFDQGIGRRTWLEGFLGFDADRCVRTRSNPVLRTSALSISLLPFDRIASFRPFSALSASFASG